MKLKILLLIFLAYWLYSGQAESPSQVNLFKEFASNYLDMEDIDILIYKEYPVARFQTENNETRFFIQTADFVEIFGYSGITNLGIIMSESGEIVSIEIIRSGDTRSYVRHMNRSGYLDQFIGYSGEQQLTTLTGATISTQAVNETVKKTVNELEGFFRTQEHIEEE